MPLRPEFLADEKQLLALCLWREARGESLEAQHAVAAVILNRTRDPKRRWPKTIRSVILQPWQFSSFNSNDVNSSKYPGPGDNSWLSCCTAAAAALRPASLDPTRGANHYHDRSVLPKWSNPKALTTSIGAFRFYRL